MMDDDSMGDMMMGSTSSDESSFCSGTGTVMLMGFQSAAKSSVSCVLFLFQGAAVDTEVKYAFAVVGAFLMAFATEIIRYSRDSYSKGAFSKGATAHSFCGDIIRAVAFAVQMLVAYFLMLLIMLYEYVFLIAIILGLSTGHFLTLRLAACRKTKRQAAGEKDTSQDFAASSSTPCCNNATSA